MLRVELDCARVSEGKEDLRGESGVDSGGVRYASAVEVEAVMLDCHLGKAPGNWMGKDETRVFGCSGNVNTVSATFR